MNLHSVLTYYFALLLSIVLSTYTGPGMVLGSNQSAEQSRLISALDSTAAAYVADSTIAGAAVAVVHQGEYLLLQGYGMADLEFNVPMPADGIFEVGSITKQFTAAAILQLVERGLVELDADITEYLPDYNTQGHHVTVRHLLHHTSGLREITTMSQRFVSWEELPRDTILSLVETEPYRFVPGTAMSYCNTGYIFLGHIIEQASGQSYESYLEECLLQPAGMHDSHYCNEQAVVSQKVHGYSWINEGTLRHRAYVNHAWPYAAGSLCSTAPDLVSWQRALHYGKILSDSLYQMMITPGQLSDGTTLRYAMGLEVYQQDRFPVIRHSGGISGFVSESRFYPQDDLIIVILQNTNGSGGTRSLADSLAQLIIGPGIQSMNERYEGDLSEFTGRYVGPSGWGDMRDLHIGTDAGKLVVTYAKSGNKYTLKYVSDLTWQQVSGNRRFTFIRIGNHIVELRRDWIYGHDVLRRIREP